MTLRWTITVAISKILLLLLVASPAAETNSATKLLELARARFGELLPAEEELFRAVANGELSDYSEPLGKDNDPAAADKWASDRVLRASRIVWLCTDPQAAALVTYHGITVKGARIDEEIDLNFARLSFPLRFFSCAFTDTLSLIGAHLLILDLGASYLRGLEASWAQIESSISLNNGFKNRGEVRLWGATVGGNLDCDSAGIFNGGGNALSCDGAEISGNVFLNNGFKAEGLVSLVGATIGGGLACDLGQLINREGNALSCDGAKISGNVFLGNGFKAEGGVTLVGVTIGGGLTCDGGQFLNPKGNAFYAKNANINGDASFSPYLKNPFRADGSISLVGATIGGDLNCSGGILSSQTGSALSCDGVKIAGSVFLNNGFKAEGLVSLVGVTIGGGLACDGGQVINREGNALSCDGAKISGNVFWGNGFKAEGGVRLVGATIGGGLSCDGGQFLNPKGALYADNANINGGASFGFYDKNPFIAEGRVSLVGATIGGNLNCNGAILNSQTGSALSCDGAKITGNVFLNNDFRAEGEVRLVGATIGEDLNCDRATLIGAGGRALSCDRATVAGNIFLRYGFKTGGDVILVGATIGANLDCDGGILSSQTGSALSCDGAKIMGNVFLNNGFKAEGGVGLLGVTIGEDVNCERGIFIGRRAPALSCDGAKITGNVFLNNSFKAEGKVDFTAATVDRYFYWQDVTSPELTALDLESAKVGVLADDEKSWPAKKRLVLDGLTYDRIADGSPTNADSRVKWLKLQGRFLPQPYEQLAVVLRKMGHDEQAVEVMINKNNAHARLVHFPSQEWLWYKGFGRLIAYGYRPWYAFGWGLFMIGVGWWVFGSGRKHEIMIEAQKEAFESVEAKKGLPKWYPNFNPFIYSLESFVPLLKLEMGEYWRPVAEAQAKTKLSFWRDFPLWLFFCLYVVASWIISPLRAITSGAKACTNKLEWQKKKFERPKEGTLLRYYLWFHIIAGWVITTLWVAALTGLVKS